MERLQKFLARCGVASRRAAERLIVEGHVRVNGAVADQLGARVAPEHDRVEVDGRLVEPPSAKVYIALNKPIGVVATARDPWGRPTVLDLVPKVGRIFPVGRLDADSEGLILLTNHGDLAPRVTHPRYGGEMESGAVGRGRPTETALEELRSGVELAEGRTAPAEVDLLEPLGPDRVWLRVTLREGKKRQVRRMLAAVNLPVERLIRVRIGPLELGELPPGRCRPLARSEVAALRAAVGGLE
jgi:23S rRNA pseudouridine2605 synthase